MAKIIKVETAKAPKALGPYSQGVVAGEFIYCSGQIAVDPKSGLINSQGIYEETRQVLDNLTAVLLAAGSGLDRVVKVEVYLKNMADFKIMNEVYGEYFKLEPLPARVTVAVSELPKGALLEISCVAYKK